MYIKSKYFRNEEFLSFHKFLFRKDNNQYLLFDKYKSNKNYLENKLKYKDIYNNKFFIYNNMACVYMEQIFSSIKYKDFYFYFYISYDDTTAVYKLDSKYFKNDFFKLIDLNLSFFQNYFYKGKTEYFEDKSSLNFDGLKRDEFTQLLFDDLKMYIHPINTYNLMKGIKSIGYFIPAPIISLYDSPSLPFSIDIYKAEKDIAKRLKTNLFSAGFNSNVSYIDIFSLYGDFENSSEVLDFGLITNIVEKQIFVDIMNNLNEIYFDMITQQQYYNRSYLIYRFDYQKSLFSPNDFINYLIKVKTEWKKSGVENQKYINDLKTIKKYINDNKLIESKNFFQKLEEGIPSCKDTIEDLKIFIHHYNVSYYLNKTSIYIDSLEISSKNKSFFKKLILILFEQYEYSEEDTFLEFKNYKGMKSMIEQRNKDCAILDKKLGDLGKIKRTDLIIERFLMLNKNIDAIGYLKQLNKTFKNYTRFS